MGLILVIFDRIDGFDLLGSEEAKTAMRVPIDRTSEVSLYRQIVDFLAGAIRTGELPPGTRLPATRELARDLGLARITVTTAYAELEADGLVEGRVGAGTFVLPPPPRAAPLSARENAWPPWQLSLAAAAPTGPVVYGPDVIDLSTGVGDAGRFPVDELRRTLAGVLRGEGLGALSYGDHRGDPALRATIAHLLASQGLCTSAESVLVTSGSQQALALAAQVLLRPGDAVIVEGPTYGGALELFRSLGARPIGVPVDRDGMRVEELEPLLQRHHPRLIYTIPNFQNPTGACLSARRRSELLALAERYNVPLLEDDFVGDLRYDGRALPALKALDPGGRVLYASTFSKMLMPGLRIGFLVTDGPVREAVAAAKHAHDMATSNLLQRALEAYVTVGRYRAHLRRSCRLYRGRRDAALAAVARHLPAATRVDPPSGGLFLWLRLPAGISAAALLPEAVAAGMAFAPGGRFFPDPVDGDGCLRLNFAAQPPEVLERGIERLGRVLR